MIHKKRFFNWFCFVLVSVICHAQNSKTLFIEVPSERSGITFNNDIKENLTTNENLFDFDFFYNGAGVGIGDFNNDGLQDIVFTANQKKNELYINKGKFQFEKIRNAFGTQESKHWSNGVSIVDINDDGYVDIYISQGGPFQPNQRANLLYINNGDLTFTESASAYGLADQGISTQSAFFDYDKDGDLDCIVMNENGFYGLDPISFYQAIGEDENIFWQNCSHFYINENGRYQDATEQVGMLKPSFGLGLVVSDLNNDGWQDVYVANDYYIPDAMYINKGDGTFGDEIKNQTSQMSFYGMGADVADINNDGFQDIFVLDMASSDHYRSKTLMRSMNVDNFRLLVNTLRFPYQYMFNSLQVNNGAGHFSNVAQLSGVAKTDWSWSVLMNDFDLDGHKDIFITNGYRRYALDNDFQSKVLSAKYKYNGNVPLSEKRSLYDQMPTEPLSNIVYQGKGDLGFVERTAEWGMQKSSYSNGAAIADFDQDGDLDLVVNNIDEVAHLWRNQSVEEGLGNYIVIHTPDEVPLQVKIFYDDIEQVIEPRSVRGYMSSSEKIAHFGVGDTKKVKLVEVEWMDGSVSQLKNAKTNKKYTIDKNSAMSNSTLIIDQETKYQLVNPQSLGIDYSHKENNYDDFKMETLLPYKQSTIGPKVVKGDYNGDGLDDLLMLGGAGQSNELYQQTEEGFTQMELSIFEEDKKYEDVDAVFFDLNSDGYQDIYFVTGGNEFPKDDEFYVDRVYLNEKGKGFRRAELASLNSIRYSGSVVKKTDFDKDGDDDIVVGNRIIPQMYPYHAPSFLFENVNGVLKDVTDERVPELKEVGIINDIEIADINNDGMLDILTVGEWSSINAFIFDGEKYENQPESVSIPHDKGWWYSITTLDANKDGRMDYVIGNAGMNSKYSASHAKPLKIYGGDMDDNGTWDVVLSKKYKDNYVPFRGKECSTNQMPFLKEKFPTYDLFATASIEDVYGEKLKSSYEGEVTNMSHSILMSKKKGYQLMPLPNDVQKFPILDAISIDNEIIVTGNIYNTEVETPRLDAESGYGLEMKSENEWKVSSPAELGIDVLGNTKSILSIDHTGLGTKLIIIGMNNEPIRVFRISEK